MSKSSQTSMKRNLKYIAKAVLQLPLWIIGYALAWLLDGIMAGWHFHEDAALDEALDEEIYDLGKKNET